MISDDQERGCVGVGLKTIETEGIQYIQNSMLKFYRIWNELGLKDDQQEQRARTMWDHIRNLLGDISEEECNFCEDVKERIQNYTKKIEQYSSILEVTPVEIQGSLIEKEEMLRQELDSLVKLKTKRIKAYQDLKHTEGKYCQILNLSEHKISSNAGVPTEKDILELQHHISMLKEEKERRYSKFCRLKADLTTILEETALELETIQEREIVYNRENIPLSNETFKTLEDMITRAQKKKLELETRKKAMLEKLSVLWSRLKVNESLKARFLSNHTDCKVTTLISIEEELDRCEKLKRENLKLFIDDLKTELEQLWSKSCISDSQKPEFHLHSSSEPTDEVLENYEAEVEKWKSYLSSVGHILETIRKRQQLFDLLLTFDQKATDPNRFKNRKGNLLKEERMRNKLQKDLPALETDIFRNIEVYETEHGSPFLYFGEDFRTLVTKQWSERMKRKENVKLERHKQSQLKANVTVGTPSNKPLASSPKSAPSKFKSSVGTSLFRTPVPRVTKTTPNSAGKLTSRFGKLFSSEKKVSNQLVLQKARNDTTTYSEFAVELNSTKRHKLRSSVLATRKPGGTRISQGSRSSKASRKSGNTSKLKNTLKLET